MTDQVTAGGAESKVSKFKPHPFGQYVGQCVDCIALGEKMADFPGTIPYPTTACALVYRTGERNEEIGEYIDLHREFHISMGEKANLRKHLEQWRGKTYTQEQIDAGVPLDKLVGNHGLLTVAHETSKANGRIYAKITACVGIPVQMKSVVTNYPDYIRDDEFWNKKKAQYAEDVAKFRATTGATAPANADEFPGALQDESDDLPF